MTSFRFHIILLFLTVFSSARAQDSTVKHTGGIREVDIPFEINVYCENMRSSVKWDLSAIDSTIRPGHLQLIGYAFETDDDTVRNIIKRQLFDSTYLAEKSHYWISNPGYYKIDYFDTLKKIHYFSHEMRIDACSQYLLPDQFLYAPGAILTPLKNVNVEKIDLVIFNSAGNEIFSTKNPQILWDGRDITSGLLCAPGSYFYNCDVYEKKGDRIVKRNITGIIDLLY